MSRGYFHLFTGLLRVISRFRTVQCDLGVLANMTKLILFWFSFFFFFFFGSGSGSVLYIDFLDLMIYLHT